MIGVGIVCTGLPFYLLVVKQPKCCQDLSATLSTVMANVFNVEDVDRKSNIEKIDTGSIPLVPPAPVEADLKNA